MPVLMCRGIRELRQGRQRLLKICHGFVVRGAGCRPHPGLAAVGQGFIPQLAPHGVMGQAVHLLGQALGREGLQRRDDPAVETRRRSWSSPL